MDVTALLDVRTVLLLVVFLAGLWWFLMPRLPENFPPGPRPLPIIGNLHMIVNPVTAHEILMDLTFKEGYGPLVGLKMGSHLAILLNRIDVFKEAMIEHGDNFSAMPKNMAFFKSLFCRKSGRCSGMFFNDGPSWKANRRFTLRSMRDLGLGRDVQEEAIKKEARIICEWMDKDVGKPQDMTYIFGMATANIIGWITFGTRFDYDNQEYRDMMTIIMKLFSSPVFTSPFNFFPMLQAAASKFWDDGPIRRMDAFREFARKQVERHRAKFDPNNIRDMCDQCLELEAQREASDLDMEDVEQDIIELFLGGTETTSTTLKWLLLYFLRYPDVMRKCVQEVDTVVGQSREPRLADKTKLNYTMATIHETMRHTTLAPLPAARATHEEVTIRGYTIPKGTLVYYNVYAMHNDPEQWPDPKKFQPERWLDKQGQFQKRDSFVPFSAGPRVCIGEALSRDQLILITTFLLQRYEFHVAGKMPCMIPIVGLTTAPRPYKLILKAR